MRSAASQNSIPLHIAPAHLHTEGLGGTVLNQLDLSCTHAVVRHSQQALLRSLPPGVLVVAAEFVTTSAELGRLSLPDPVSAFRV